MKNMVKKLAERVGFGFLAPLILRKLLILKKTQHTQSALLCRFITHMRNWALLLPAALLLTGCNSDPSVPIGSFWLATSFCAFLLGLLFYVLKAIRLIKKLQAESTRGICTRIGTIDLNEEEGTVSLDGWSFQGGFTGFVVHGYRMSELEAMQKVEIDRVAKRAVSEVSV